MVHLDAQGLEHLGHIFFPAFARQDSFNGIYQILCGLDGLLTSALHDGRCQSPCVFQFPVEIEDVRQSAFVGFVEQFGSRHSGPFVHPHIERGIETEGESPRLVVEMMARHAQIGQQTVDVLHIVVAHPVFQVAEIASHERETLVVHDVFLRVGILVETVQMALLAQSAQYLPAVTAAAERHVHIDAVGLDVQSVDTLLQENRYVIHVAHSLFPFSVSFITSSRACANVSASMKGFSVFSTAQISMVSSMPMNFTSRLIPVICR